RASQLLQCRQMQRRHKEEAMSERKEKKKKLRELLLFVPNLMKLLYDLLKDPRVSRADKAILAGVIMYVIVPIDVIPDFVPFVGMVDDSYLIAISLLRLLNRADRQVVLEHWKGDIDIKQLVEKDRKSIRLNSSHSQISYAVF